MLHRVFRFFREGEDVYWLVQFDEHTKVYAKNIFIKPIF
jgi:hypothetical protein